MTHHGGLYSELIERGAAQNADRIAVEFGEERQTFAEVNALANQLAHAFGAAGCGRSHRVGLLVNNGLLSVPLDFACAKAGINRVPLNARLSVSEHARMLAEAQCSALIFGPDLAERAAELKAIMPELRCFGLGITPEGGEDFLALAQLLGSLCDARRCGSIVTGIR